MGLGKVANGILEVSGSGGGPTTVTNDGTFLAPGGNVVVTSSALPSGGSTAAKQDTGNTSLASIDGKLTNPLPVSAAALPLPSGASTSALQSTGNTSLASIDGKLTNPLPVSASSLPLPTGAATEATVATLATQVTLALIKAKTDNLDVALSTRTKPADQQHVIVDSGTITATVTNPLPISAASLPLPSGASTSANQTTEITSLQIIDDPVYTKGGTQLIQAPALSFSSDGGTAVTTSTTTDASTTPGGGNHIEVFRLHCANSSATPVLVQWKEASGATMFSTYLPQYGVFSVNLQGGWRLTTATKLQMVTTGTGSIYWNTGYRTVAD